MTAYLAGCLILACMAGVSVTIIGPGLARAIGIVFPNLGPAVRALFPARSPVARLSKDHPHP